MPISCKSRCMLRPAADRAANDFDRIARASCSTGAGSIVAGALANRMSLPSSCAAPARWRFWGGGAPVEGYALSILRPAVQAAAGGFIRESMSLRRLRGGFTTHLRELENAVFGFGSTS